ncbi:MAG: hypothetical protein LBW85_12570, partial [Deltaproteobacteria bacterium]|nr:hypothetical protein [Deltaproteobacteria bacterium]
NENFTRNLQSREGAEAVIADLATYRTYPDKTPPLAKIYVDAIMETVRCVDDMFKTMNADQL